MIFVGGRPWTSGPFLTTIFLSLLPSTPLQILYLPGLDKKIKKLGFFFQDAPAILLILT